MATSPKDAVAYHNGTIYTVNDKQPYAEAFIVSPEDTFAAVGSNDEILNTARRDKLLTYDLHGQWICPGFHDAHVHLLTAGLSRLSNYKPGMDVTNSNIAERMKSQSCACEYAHTYGNWLVGDFYRIEDFDRASLDEEFPDTPIVLRGGAGHALFANTAALEQAGYSIDSEPDEPNSNFYRDSSGKLTGEMTEMAMTKALLALPKPPPFHIKRCVLEAISTLHRAGVTSCQEASANTILLHALQSLEKSHLLKMDIATHIVHFPEHLAEEPFSTLHPLLANSSTYSSPHVHTNFVKIMLDGVPLPPYYTHADLITNPSSSNPSPDLSKIQLPPSSLHTALTTYTSQNKTVKIHCTGHGATRLALETIGTIRESHSNTQPDGMPRHEIAHCSGVHASDYPLFARHNVTAEMSPSMFFVHPITAASDGLMDWNWGMMLQAGAHVTVGSDWSFQDEEGMRVVGALAGVLPKVEEYFVNLRDGGDEEQKAKKRKVEEGGEEGEEDEVGWAKRKAAETLIRMLTLNGAEAVGMEDSIGSIEVGKKANFVMMSRDLAKGEFKGATVERTWFEGEIVWDARQGRRG